MRRSPTQTNVSSSLLNCASEMSLSRNATCREFQKHGPATQKLLSPRRVRVLVAHVKTSADRSDRLRCRPRADNLQPGTVKAGRETPCAQEQLTWSQCPVELVTSAAPGELVWYAPVFQFSWSVGQRNSGPTGVSAAGYRQFHTAGCCSSLAYWIRKPIDGPPS